MFLRARHEKSRASMRGRSGGGGRGLILWLMVPFLFLFVSVGAWTSVSSEQHNTITAKPRRRASIRSSFATTSLDGISKSQVAVLDGAEWVSVQRLLQEQGRHPTRTTPSQIGYMTVLTGSTLESPDERIVGIQAEDDDASGLGTVRLSDTVHIYKDSMATIPNKMSDTTAIETLISSLASVHCALPRIDHVGGSEEASFVSGKVVIMGGSDYACFAAEGLAAMGATAHLVTTNAPKIKSNQVQVLTPAIGELEVGFSTYVGEFDVLLDTMSDEARGRMVLTDDRDNGQFYGRAVGGVVEELSKQHNCRRYVSTMSASQRIVRDEGVFFGPKKADQHMAEVTKAISTKSQRDDDYQKVIPPAGFCVTLQTLLNKDITYSWKAKSKYVAIRGWALKEFWELTTWPRDSSVNVRFGLPVVEDVMELYDDDDVEDERMISDPTPYLREKFKIEEGMTRAQIKENEEEKAATSSDPFVTNIEGVKGLQLDIILPKRDCLLFLSAPWCRTCKSLSQGYTRMARQHGDESLLFAKANASGKQGKLLGKVLEVEVVPSFVMFRRGKLYGTPLGVTRLPSEKLNRALEHMRDGEEWDSSILQEDTTDLKDNE